MTISDSKIVVLSCNWDGWSCVESAIAAGSTYPSAVQMVRITCLSRIHTGLLLKAFELGADGVVLLGCETDQCQFNADSQRIESEIEKTRDILNLLGIEGERLALIRLPAFGGQQLMAQLDDFITKIENMKKPAAVTSGKR